MSIRVMANVWERASVAGSRLLTLLALADWADDRGRCDPSFQQLADKLRCTRRQAIRIAQALEAEEEIVVHRGEGFRFEGHGSSNAIILEKYRGDTYVTPVKPRGDTDVTSTSDTDVTPTSDTDVTHNSQLQQSTTTVNNGAPNGARKWDQFHERTAAMFGGIQWKKQNGQVLAAFGKVSRVVGPFVGDDPELGVKVLDEYESSGEFFVQSPNRLPAAIGKWLRRQHPQGYRNGRREWSGRELTEVEKARALEPEALAFLESLEA